LSASPILDCPLALCDFRTINPEDLVPMNLVYPHFVDEAYEVRYNPSHRWLYKKEMGPDDVIIFKLYDNLRSEATGKWSCETKCKAILANPSSLSPFCLC
jgi:hypothetical protein